MVRGKRPEGSTTDGRRNNRRLHPRRPSGAPDIPAGTDALEGEKAPLRWQEGRGPVTDLEALLAWRRRMRISLAKNNPELTPDEIESKLPNELPARGTAKRVTSHRLSYYDIVLLEAVAELENTTVTAQLEELIAGRIRTPPRNPEQVARLHQDMFDDSTGAAARRAKRASRRDEEIAELRAELEALRAQVSSSRKR